MAGGECAVTERTERRRLRLSGADVVRTDPSAVT